MRIGIPREVKQGECRVGATPEMVRALVRAGHEVVVEAGAGVRIGYSDRSYAEAGAGLAQSLDAVFAATMIVKVKEPQPSELPLLREDHILLSFLHLSANRSLAEGLLQSGCCAIAYETVMDESGRLPLLRPMSEIAGMVAIQSAAVMMQVPSGGRGILLGRVAGVAPPHVVVIGAGSVGMAAARTADALGADVTLLDIDVERLSQVDAASGGRMQTRFSTEDAIVEEINDADLVVGAVLSVGRRAPKVLTREMIRTMKRGAILLDVAIDQGGCSETSRPTTHAAPSYEEEGVVHYCVTNIPGACARTATQCLSIRLLPYLLEIGEKGLRHSAPLLRGLNICKGQVTCRAVAEELGFPFTRSEEALHL